MRTRSFRSLKEKHVFVVFLYFYYTALLKHTNRDRVDISFADTKLPQGTIREQQRVKQQPEEAPREHRVQSKWLKQRCWLPCAATFMLSCLTSFTAKHTSGQSIYSVCFVKISDSACSHWRLTEVRLLHFILKQTVLNWMSFCLSLKTDDLTVYRSVQRFLFLLSLTVTVWTMEPLAENSQTHREADSSINW